MMQAAQLAAEAAMKEAAARDAAAAAAHSRIPMHHTSTQQESSAYGQMMDMDASGSSLGIDNEQLGLLQALQAAQMRDEEQQQVTIEQQQLYLQQQKQNQQNQEILEALIQQNPNLLQEIQMMGIDPNDPDSVQSLLQMLAQQEQENARPEEHYLTIAQNGMILEATKTVTGFPPDALLMTSA